MRGLRAHYHLLPDQDEEQPTECTEPDSEEQPGWEGAPVTPPAPEEPCRLVLSTPSSILQEREIEELGPHLPTRLQQQPWSLLYCTARDGFSLRTLYRCTGRLSSPALLLIRDTEAQAFGAFSTSPIHVSSGFYGTGETFLFSFSPELKVFRWTGRNSFFLKGDTDLLMVGGGSGKFGLWVDGDLHHGGSCPCETFNNESLSARGEFCIQDLEALGRAVRTEPCGMPALQRGAVVHAVPCRASPACSTFGRSLAEMGTAPRRARVRSRVCAGGEVSTWDGPVPPAAALRTVGAGLVCERLLATNKWEELHSEPRPYCQNNSAMKLYTESSSFR